MLPTSVGGVQAFAVRISSRACTWRPSLVAEARAISPSSSTITRMPPASSRCARAKVRSRHTSSPVSASSAETNAGPKSPVLPRIRFPIRSALPKMHPHPAVEPCLAGGRALAAPVQVDHPAAAVVRGGDEQGVVGPPQRHADVEAELVGVGMAPQAPAVLRIEADHLLLAEHDQLRLAVDVDQKGRAGSKVDLGAAPRHGPRLAIERRHPVAAAAQRLDDVLPVGERTGSERVVLVQVEHVDQIMRPPQRARARVERMQVPVHADGEQAAARQDGGGVGTRPGRIQPDLEVAVAEERRVVGMLPAGGAGGGVEGDDHLIVVLPVHREQEVAAGENRRVPFAERPAPKPGRAVLVPRAGDGGGRHPEVAVRAAHCGQPAGPGPVRSWTRTQARQARRSRWQSASVHDGVCGGRGRAAATRNGWGE